MSHFYDDGLRISNSMFAVISLNRRVDTNGYPGRFNQVRPEQWLASGSDPHVSAGLTTLVNAGNQANIISELAFIIESSDVAQFSKNGNGQQTTDA
jgi:hypothetical protein